MLQRSSPVPLYQQLKLLLADRITRGEWKPGELIPGEHELQAIHSLSRTTVRQALQELEREGFVTRHRGRGTFVAQPRAPGDGGHASVHEYLLAQGIRPGWRVLLVHEQPAPPEVAARLQLAAGAPVLTSRRLRLANERPLGYLEAHVPVDLLGPGPLDHAELGVGGSLDYLRHRGLLRGSTTQRSVAAAAATPREAELLELAPGAPVLKIQRLIVGADGRPLEDCSSTYRGDRFRYRLPAGREPG